MSGIKLGQSNSYCDKYDKNLLEAIPRSLSREALSRDGLTGDILFYGWDYWTAYELSWLAPSGVPQVAIAEFAFAADNPNIVESKSFKYYLNSFNQTFVNGQEELVDLLVRDLTEITRGEVRLKLFDLSGDEPSVRSLLGKCIDAVDCKPVEYRPNKKLLSVNNDVVVERETLFSHLLKSNCPVTGQPDWASIWVTYSGKKIDEASLLKYVISFRQYEGFHESCIERIYCDLLEVCGAESLSVFGRYTRRGGLDINPFRASDQRLAESLAVSRTLRQ